MRKKIESDVYDKDYLLSRYLEGFEEFKAGKLSVVKNKQLQMLNLKEGVDFLEVGIGRGELLYHCAKTGANVSGIDYSKDALEIARNLFKDNDIADIREASCTDLPFSDESFDRVFSGDVIEHQDYDDAIKMLQELKRVLKPGGRLLLHTTPNTIFTKITYRLGKWFLRILDNETVKKIDEHIKLGDKFHIYEFNLLSLRRVCKKAGLEEAKVWIDSDILRSSQHGYTKVYGSNIFVRLIATFSQLNIVRFFFGNDLYLSYQKPLK